MYQSHILLEVRILVSNKEKAFCSCHIGNKTGTCPVCRKEDNAFPIVNPIAVKNAYTLAHALDCQLENKVAYEIPEGSPSLPPQYSLSGASLKIAHSGYMDIEFHRRKKRIPIEEIRIEEDAGRLTHSKGEAKMDYSHIGAPNIRIRTGKCFELGEEAEIFLTELRRRIQYTGILKGTPPESVIRCNAYVALARYPENPDYLVKLRNLNSFNFVRKAINEELHRQELILSSKQMIVSESRLWNELQNRTVFFQSRDFNARLIVHPIKNAAQFECPSSLLAVLRASATEYPSERQTRLIKTWNITKHQAEFICDEKSRADYFEQTVEAGADPFETLHWLSSELLFAIRKANQTLLETPLSPLRFAQILYLYHNRIINNKITKQLIQAVIETDKDPEVCIKENKWILITDPQELLPLIDQILDENPKEAEKIQKGELGPLEFLTGLVMKKTKEMADPATVKELIKKQLNLQLVYVLPMGGSISGKVADGLVSAGDEKILETLVLEKNKHITLIFEKVTKQTLLSEEINPSDWAALIHKVAQILSNEAASGIVITHGTDTLSYTAPLIYWLFADSPIPIVFTASNTTPSQDKTTEIDEARYNFNKAIQTAFTKTKGVYVVFGDKILSPVNLKFISTSAKGFTNWNISKLEFTGRGLLSNQSEIDPYVTEQILSEAANRLFLCRLYPGLRAELVLSMAEKGTNRFVLELYEKGTANMKDGPYSIKDLLIQGKKKGCRFYCTSQQEGLVDFTEFSTSRRMWREGVLPMGRLTTETVIALFYAASLVSDSDEELEQIMESHGAS